MVVIRMKRAGAKGRPFYRVVVADSRSRRDGRYIEQLGYYDPLTDPATFNVDAEKFAAWIRKGATPSESVGVMMAKHAPEALRPVPLVPNPMADVPAPAETPKPKKRARKKAAAKKKTPKRAATKGEAKKAKARAKKKRGVAPKRAVKKPRKKKS